MTTTKNPLPANLQPNGDICIPVSVPNDTEWLWLMVKCLSFPNARRFWKDTHNEAEMKLIQSEWESRVYSPLVQRVLEWKLCAFEESDDCIEQPPNYEGIGYAPIDPFAERGTQPEGWLIPPLLRFGDVIPDWLEGFAEQMTGYQPNDVLSLYGSVPTDWETLTSGFARFTLQFSGRGRILIHFLTVPFGGRAMISIDVDLNPFDVMRGLINDGFRVIELERDLSSFPPEDDIDHIEEIEFRDGGSHTVYVTFLPVLDDSLVPIAYGGGLRSVEYCLEDEEDWVIDCEYVKNCLDGQPEQIALNNITLTNMEITTQNFLNDLADLYDGTNPNSIDADIPTTAPNAAQQNALCYTIEAWLYQYAQAKLAKLRSKGQLAQFWNDIQTGIINAYGGLNNVIGWVIPDNLFGCFVSDNEAITALSDDEALDEVKCCLYDEMDSVPLLSTTLAGAISACATALSGTNAGKIACLIDNDLAQGNELNFYYMYGRAIENTLSGDCGCLSYDWCYEWDFTINNGGFVGVDWFGTGSGNYVNGVGWQAADYTSSGFAYRRMSIRTPTFAQIDSNLTELELTMDYQFGHLTANNTTLEAADFINLRNSNQGMLYTWKGTEVSGPSFGGTNIVRTKSGLKSQVGSFFVLQGYTSYDNLAPITYSGEMTLKKLRLKGTGTMPAFTGGQAC